jgi:hypothetical protein
MAIAMLEAWSGSHGGDADALGALADVLFDGSRGVRPTVDATEYLAAAGRAARAALAIDADCPLALLNLGALEVFGGMVLAQPMGFGIAKLERALRADGLSAAQRAKANFFLGKAHQMELRDAESDRYYRRALPSLARPLYPLVRARLRSFP